MMYVNKVFSIICNKLKKYCNIQNTLHLALVSLFQWVMDVTIRGRLSITIFGILSKFSNFVP